MEQQQGNARYLCSPHTFHMWENGREVPWVGCFCWALQVAWFLGVWGYRLKNSTRVTLAIIREHVTTYVMRKTWGYFMIWFSLKFYQCFLNVFPRFFDLGTSQICANIDLYTSKCFKIQKKWSNLRLFSNEIWIWIFVPKFYIRMYNLWFCPF